MEKILIVEDDADIREGVRILLEGEGYSIMEAENGRKGLELLSEEPDLVILDVMMPGMSGLKTCEEIRKVSYVPVLFLTARSQESDKLIGLMAGGDDYLPKPFSYCSGASRRSFEDGRYTGERKNRRKQGKKSIWSGPGYGSARRSMKSL